MGLREDPGDQFLVSPDLSQLLGCGVLPQKRSGAPVVPARAGGALLRELEQRDQGPAAGFVHDRKCTMRAVRRCRFRRAFCVAPAGACIPRAGDAVPIAETTNFAGNRTSRLAASWRRKSASSSNAPVTSRGRARSRNAMNARNAGESAVPSQRRRLDHATASDNSRGAVNGRKRDRIRLESRVRRNRRLRPQQASRTRRDGNGVVADEAPAALALRVRPLQPSSSSDRLRPRVPSRSASPSHGLRMCGQPSRADRRGRGLGAAKARRSAAGSAVAGAVVVAARVAVRVVAHHRVSRTSAAGNPDGSRMSSECRRSIQKRE